MAVARGPGRGYQSADFTSFRQERTLTDYPGEYLNLECLHADCGRKGRLRKDRLIAHYGATIGLNTLLLRLRPKDCPRNFIDPQGFNRCAACYGRELLEGVELPR